MDKEQFTAVQITGTTATELFKELAEIRQAITDLKPTEPKATLLTREQTAKMLGVSKVTLYHWTKQGKIKAYKIGSQVRFKESEIITALHPTSDK